MKKFKFRLQQVLEYRMMEEQWAKEAFLTARLATLECEGDIQDLITRRKEMLKQPVGDIHAHRAIERLLQKSDDDERAKHVALEVLKDEEAAALEQWKFKRRELEVLKSLREEAYAAWQKESDHQEQAALDEWATTRRAA